MGILKKIYGKILQVPTFKRLRIAILNYLALKKLEGCQDVKLHIGCGAQRLDGYFNIDSYPASGVDAVLPPDRLRLPDDSADEIYIADLVEKLFPGEFLSALHEWYRVLKPGGKLRIRCRNLEVYVREWLAGEYDNRWNWATIDVFGEDTSTEAPLVRNGFTRERLDRLLSENGFRTLTCELRETGPESDGTTKYRPDGAVYYEGVKVSLPKVLYIETISTPTAQTNIDGMVRAYRRVSLIKPFDYRGLVQRHGKAAMNRLLVETAVRFKPDLLHLGKAELIDGQTIRRIKEQIDTCVIHYYGDFRWEPRPWVVDIGQCADYTLVQYKDPGEIKKLRDLGVSPIGFWWQGTDPEVMYPRDVPRTKDVIFMANNSDLLEGHKERRALIAALKDAGIELHLYGRGWDYLAGKPCVHLHPNVQGADFAGACSAAKIALNLGSVTTVYFYDSWPRLFNTMACGTFYLTKFFPGLETIFENHKHLVWYHSIPEAIELIQYYLAHNDEREAIAQAGRQEVLAHHTWDHRVAEMFRYLARCKED